MREWEHVGKRKDVRAEGEEDANENRRGAGRAKPVFSQAWNLEPR